jgi:hypothetical protein
MRPVFCFAFFVCSLPVNHFCKRNLVLISCVSPNFAKEDNPAILPSSPLRNLENNTVEGVAVMFRLVLGLKKKKNTSGDNSSNGDSSSFSHMVQFVSQSQENS